MLWKNTVIGMNNYGHTIEDDLFEHLALPESLDREVVINQILITTGELPVAYPDYEFLKNQIRVWSNRKLPIFNHMVELLDTEFNPLHNYDRYEEIEDGEEIEGSTSSETSGSSENDVTTTSKATSYDSDTFKNTEQDVVDGETSTSTESSGSNESSRSYTHEAHLYGNIGVTTSVDMLKQAMEWYQTDIPQIIAEEFKCDFCIGIY